MNELRVFNADVIPVYATDTGEKVVYGRELQDRLCIKGDYTSWMKEMIAYGFTYHSDYDEFWQKGSDMIFEDAHFKSPNQATALGYSKNHLLKFDMAKHIAMIQRTPEGKAVRQKLIDLEEKYKEEKEKKKVAQDEQKRPSLTAVTGAAKFLTSLTEKAGCDGKIQLLTAKSFYETNGYPVLVEIGADKQYWDTVHIARQVGIYVKSSGKPADKAVNEIIRRIGVTEGDYVDTWESKGKWQGTVRKYSDSVIERVKCWIADNDYPSDIEYQQADGQTRAWHVTYQKRDKAQTDAKAI